MHIYLISANRKNAQDLQLQPVVKDFDAFGMKEQKPTMKVHGRSPFIAGCTVLNFWAEWYAPVYLR